MKKNLLNISGIYILSKSKQKELTGGFSSGPFDLSKCTCECNVYRPSYCDEFSACPAVQCDEVSVD